MQNFKGIGDPVTIPIRPLTILFGKNSAGKSTVIQALHYAREVLLHNNPNADRTDHGDSLIDLGGFRSFVHKRNLGLAVTMRLESNIAGNFFPIYEDPESGISEVHMWPPPDPNNDPFRAILGKDLYTECIVPLDENRQEVMASVEFTVRWSEAIQNTVITEYRTRLAGEDAGLVTRSLDGIEVTVAVNANHRFLQSGEESRETTDPNWIPINLETDSILNGFRASWDIGLSVESIPSDLVDLGVGRRTLSQMLLGPTTVVVGFLDIPGLRDMRSIGALREAPRRGFRPNSTHDESLWVNGLAAWNRLYNSTGDLVPDVGKWLGSGGLRTGFSMRVDQFRKVPFEPNNSAVELSKDAGASSLHRELRIIEEMTGFPLDPFDMGVGISQVVPVIVAAIDSEDRILTFEQPELHLHPAAQTELGDLFIESALGNKNQLLIETHSEHLILRVLRRIRETTEGENADSKFRIGRGDVALLYIEPTPDGTKVIELPINSDGELEMDIPGGFFAEREQELF